MHIQVTDELFELGASMGGFGGDALLQTGSADRKKCSEESRCSERRIAWASAGMRGWRETMEDATLLMPFGYLGGDWRDAALFGVFDGHGGEQVAKFAARKLPQLLSERPGTESPAEALELSYRRVDELLREPSTAKELRELTLPGNEEVDSADRCGTTAVCVLIRGSEVTVANAGDSRAVLCRQGKAVALTTDHKPILASETARIEAAGGFVVESAIPRGGTEHRVCGDLNLSRALGDLKYKDPVKAPHEQIVSGVPDTQVLSWTAGEEEFLLLACDGVWDVMGPQQVVDFIRRRLPPPGSAKGLGMVLESLLDECCATTPAQRGGLGCDNISAVLVCFEDESAVGGALVAGNPVFEAKIVNPRLDAAVSGALLRLAGRSRQTTMTAAEQEQHRRQQLEELEAERLAEQTRLERLKRRSERELKEKASKKKALCCALADGDSDDDGEGLW